MQKSGVVREVGANQSIPALRVILLVPWALLLLWAGAVLAGVCIPDTLAAEDPGWTVAVTPIGVRSEQVGPSAMFWVALRNRSSLPRGICGDASVSGTTVGSDSSEIIGFQIQYCVALGMGSTNLLAPGGSLTMLLARRFASTEHDIRLAAVSVRSSDVGLMDAQIQPSRLIAKRLPSPIRFGAMKLLNVEMTKPQHRYGGWSASAVPAGVDWLGGQSGVSYWVSLYNGTDHSRALCGDVHARVRILRGRTQVREEIHGSRDYADCQTHEREHGWRLVNPKDSFTFLLRMQLGAEDRAADGLVIEVMGRDSSWDLQEREGSFMIAIPLELPRGAAK
jgi:hypothetical protein